MGTTPVYVLDTQTFAIHPIETTGENPGWIHGHRAEPVDGRAIVVRSGVVASLKDGKETHDKNPANFRLDLASKVWTRVAQPPSGATPHAV